MFTCFLQADQVLCREQTAGATIEMTGYAGLPAESLRSFFEAQRNILACMSTCKYVACPAWELLAKPTAHDLCSEIHLPLERSWTAY